MANQEIGTDPRGADKNLVSETAQELMSNDRILSAIKSFKPKNDEDAIALEFVESYLNFMKGYIEHDVEKSINRTDFEIRDLISHVNIMMKRQGRIHLQHDGDAQSLSLQKPPAGTPRQGQRNGKVTERSGAAS
jgi:hypothetical protein